MAQPVPSADAPAEIVFTMIAMCQALPAGLRLYGHPGLLAVAASINGDQLPSRSTVQSPDRWST